MPDPLGWQDRALCAQVGGEEWFQDRGGTTKHAKRICAACPVRRQCLEYAMSLPAPLDRDGVFGGLSVRERQRLRRDRRASAEEAA